MKRKKMMTKKTVFIFLVVFLVLGSSYNACELTDSGKVKGTSTGNPFAPGQIAQLPQVYLDSSFPVLPPTSHTLTVGNGKTFKSCQPAVDAAVSGDMILIDAGFKCSPFVLRNKGNLTYFIVIQTADYNAPGFPQSGTQVNSNDASHLAIVETSSLQPAISAEAMANHYYLAGLDIRSALDSQTVLSSLFSIGATFNPTDLSQLPNNIIIARNWIHGLPTQQILRGVDLNGSAISVVDSVIEEIHSVSSRADRKGQAVAAWNSGIGPFKIDNNRIESSGANLAIGDFVSTIPNLIPSDIQFTRNTIRKNPQWQNQTSWGIDSLVHLCNAQRILMDSNVFEYQWVDSDVTEGSQHGFFINPNSGGLGQIGNNAMPWAVVQDLTISNNIFRHMPGIFRIHFANSEYPTIKSRRLDFENNLAYDVGGSLWGLHKALIDLGGSSDGATMFNHQTLLGSPGAGNFIIMARNGPSAGPFFFQNNITNSTNGIDDGQPGDNGVALAGIFSSLVFTNNALTGQAVGTFGSFGPQNFFPATLADVGFVADPTLTMGNANFDFHTLALSPSSPYRNAGNDGRDLGVNISGFKP